MAGPEAGMIPGMAELARALGRGEGWGALDPMSPDSVRARAEDAQTRFENAMVFAAPFMTPAGQRCLAALREKAVEPATWEPELGFINAIGYGFFREGQKSFVQWIESRIAIAQQGPAGDAKPARSRRKTS